MEDIKILEWIKSYSNSDFGFGNGAGYGFDDGSGDSAGYGSGGGYESGCGSSYSILFLACACSGSGSYYGNGDSSGCDDGIKLFNGKSVYVIDGVQTIISNIKGNLARGFVLKSDLTLLPCYICKNERYFAHGETLKDAREALRKKILENMDTDETIEQFLSAFEKEKKYPAIDFYEWHHYLTGSCEMGRKSFMQDRNITFDDIYTVDEFITLCEDSYGGEIIKELKERWNCRNGSD